MNEKTKILIISNSRSAATHYSFIFEDMGADTNTAGTAGEAIRLFKKQFSQRDPFDLVITTFLLPDRMTALGLAKIFIKMQPEIKIMIFPTAELYDRDVRMECDQMDRNILDADLSNTGLRRLLARLKKIKA